MARAVWKGAIVFRLVHVPVELYPGARDSNLDFVDWIDRRDMAPVGYQRINKVDRRGGAARGYCQRVSIRERPLRYAGRRRFPLSESQSNADCRDRHLRRRRSVLPQFFETPYRLMPGKRGEKGYALLGEALKKSDKIGIAQVVIPRQHRGCGPARQAVATEDVTLRCRNSRGG